MYSPRIDPEVVAQLYVLAKARGMPMTKLVNALLRKGLEELASPAVCPALSTLQTDTANTDQSGGEP